MERLAYLIVLITLFSSGAFAQIEFNDSSDIQFRTGLDMNSNSIIGLPNPSGKNDDWAATKGYVDDNAGGTSFSLSGGDGVSPSSISDGDSLSVVWGDASGLNGSGYADDFSGAGDLTSGGGIASGVVSDSEVGSISLSSVSDSGVLAGLDNVSSSEIDSNAVGDDEANITLSSVTDSGDLASLDTVNSTEIDANSISSSELSDSLCSNSELLLFSSNSWGCVDKNNVGNATDLTGGDGVSPSSITDGDTLSVAWGDAGGLNSSGYPDDFTDADDLTGSGGISSGVITDTEVSSISLSSISDSGTLAGLDNVSSSEIDANSISSSELSDSLCSNGQVLEFTSGSWSCTDSSNVGGSDGTENLSETLEAGNVANQSIDMNGSNVEEIDKIRFESYIRNGSELIWFFDSGVGSTDVDYGVNFTIQPGSAQISNGFNSIEINGQDSKAQGMFSTNTTLERARAYTSCCGELNLLNDYDGKTIANNGREVTFIFGGSLYFNPQSGDDIRLDLGNVSNPGSSGDVNFSVQTGGIGNYQYRNLSYVPDSKLNSSIQNVNRIFDTAGDSFFDGCSSGSYIESIDSDGSVTCANDDNGASNLNETLEAGNTANQSINMDGNELQNANATESFQLPVGTDAY